jgi:hypothetical protein
MKKGFRRKARPAPLPEHLNCRLSSYALAATAAGVTTLAFVMPAEGAPVCKTVSINLFHTATNPINPGTQRIPPFNLAQTTYTYYPITTGRGLSWWNRGFFTPNTAGAKLLLGSQSLPADVASGASIGPKGNFGKGASYGLMFTYGRGTIQDRANGTLLKHRGNFNLQQENYIGFEFLQAGQAHFGWARLNVKLMPEYRYFTNIELSEVQLLAYGYETIANTAIAAGACSGDAARNTDPVGPADSAEQEKIDLLSANPGSLGMLALGSEGLAMQRNKNWPQ